MIYYCQALDYAFDTYKYLHGRVVMRDFFLKLGSRLLAKYSNRFEFSTTPNVKLPIYNPKINMPGPMGFHLLDVAFQYYAGTPVPEPWRKTPLISGAPKFSKHLDLPDKYFVVCPGGTTKNRTMPFATVKHIVNFLQGTGLPVVFLGKGEITKGYGTIFDGNFDDLGHNLIDKTDLLEAAGVMAGSEGVVGFDGGLVHLAACVRVPVVMGLTVASWKNRRPFVDSYSEGVSTELDCAFCQENYIYRYDHNFRNCLYEHNNCVNISPDRFTAAIGRALGNTQRV
jgi:ADP-heptose:LPS heptosyltransferase